MIWFFRISVFAIAGTYLYGFISMHKEFGEWDWAFLVGAIGVLAIGSAFWVLP